MKILSFDVGVKNLALIILEIQNEYLEEIQNKENTKSLSNIKSSIHISTYSSSTLSSALDKLSDQDISSPIVIEHTKGCLKLIELVIKYILGISPHMNFSIDCINNPHTSEYLSQDGIIIAISFILLRVFKFSSNTIRKSSAYPL